MSTAILLPPNPLPRSIKSFLSLPSPQLTPTDHPYNQLPPPRRLLRLAADRRDLSLSRSLHAVILKSQDDGDDDTRLANDLIFTYLKLGRITDARKVLDLMPAPDVVSFTSLISAYAKSGRPLQAFRLFCSMRLFGVEPNEFTFVAILTSCIRELNCQLGTQVHAFAIKTNHCSCVHVSNALLAVYVKSGRVDVAEWLFDGMTERDVSSWNTIILGKVQDGTYDEAFRHFNLMQLEGHYGDAISLSTLLTAASNRFCSEEGEAIHAYALKVGLDVNLSVGNALIGFYTKYGSIEDVVNVFQIMPIKDVISWTGMLTGFMEFGQVESAVEVFHQMPEWNSITHNALLAGFCRNGEGSRGLELFKQILENGLEISDFTLTSAMNACALVSDLKKSEQIHALVIKSVWKMSAWIEAALLDMCAKCSRIEDAEKMFIRWVHEESFQVAWTSLICAYSRNGQHNMALSLFQSVLTRDHPLAMDEYAFAAVLGLCGSLGFVEMGKNIHCLIAKSGLLSDVEIGNALLSMYAKCGYLEDAISLFNQMPLHDSVSWNALITAHLLHRQGDQALDEWDKMQKQGIVPNFITFILIISACRYTNSNSVATCIRLFELMESSYKITPTSDHYSVMVDVLGYWGSFDEVERLIQNMPSKPDASVWRSLLNSCRLRSNVSLGRQAMQSLLTLEPKDPSTYILVANLYSASGRWHCSDKVRQEMELKGLQKQPVRSWIIHQNTTHSFFARDRSHPQSKDIYSALDILILECMKVGYQPDTCFVLHEVEESQKQNFLFYHSAKLAVTYGLLMVKADRPIKVMKNVLLCGDCHTFLKLVSSVTCREILVRDASGFHNFKGGVCSCGDYW